MSIQFICLNFRNSHLKNFPPRRGDLRWCGDGRCVAGDVFFSRVGCLLERRFLLAHDQNSGDLTCENWTTSSESPFPRLPGLSISYFFRSSSTCCGQLSLSSQPPKTWKKHWNTACVWVDVLTNSWNAAWQAPAPSAHPWPLPFASHPGPWAKRRNDEELVGRRHSSFWNPKIQTILEVTFDDYDTVILSIVWPTWCLWFGSCDMEVLRHLVMLLPTRN